ncbi:hypothetical protein B7463_g7130, partial [Scytalidium lignicola]
MDEPALPSGISEGSIDHIFDIMSKYAYPFILVGILVYRWMDCVAAADEGFDLVIRNEQLRAIATELIATGHWGSLYRQILCPE